MTMHRGRAVLLGCATLLAAAPARAAEAARLPRHAAIGTVMLPAPEDVGPGDDRPAASPRSAADPMPATPVPAAPMPTSVRGAAPNAAAATPAGPDRLADVPVSSDAPMLDAETLQRALAAWVGPEPLRGLRSIPAAVAEERRHDARAAILAFYEARGFAPLWALDGRFGRSARAALARLDRAADDGLDLRATPVAAPDGGDPGAVAAAELSLSEAAVDYAWQASGGRIDPSRIGDSVAAKPEVASPAQALAAVRDAADAGEALLAFNPPHPGYAALRAKLAELRRGGGAEDPGHSRRLEAEIVANMERWRWLPRDLGSRYVAVNIPDFSLDVVEDGRTIHHARVVVGKPDHETPVFSDVMRYVIVNPYWNVPLSIVEHEMMPKLAADPNYFADHGYEVVRKGGETFVRQPPGDSNALGRIKFLFPNRFSVYLHDTNAKSYFARDGRALSHGCVRVDQPFKLAEAVLGRDRGWTEARVAAMVGGAERTVNLPRPVEVHIDYFTAFVDGGGRLRLRGDVYGYSARVRAALGFAG